MKRFNPEKELNKVQYGDRNKLIGIIVFLLVIIAVGSTYALYQIRHTKSLVYTTVSDFKKRDIYLSVLVDGKTQGEFPKSNEGKIYSGIECDKPYSEAYFDNTEWKLHFTSDGPNKCTVKFETGNLPNAPELYQGMIPVVYGENGLMYVADTSKDWYNYQDHRWANAVLVDASQANIKSKYFDENNQLRTDIAGKEVPMEEVLQMYVWIPRYKYQLWNVNNESKPKQLINIKFEKDTENTGDIICTYENKNNGIIEENCVDKEGKNAENGDWYMHPAFTFGTTELKGIWAGKFEPSDPNDLIGRTTNQIKEITILPNKTSISGKNLKITYDAVRAIESNNKYNLNQDKIDTHIMKNIEWGAVAYLSQSIYGIYKDEKTCNIDGVSLAECEIWINNRAQGAGNNQSSAKNKWGGSATGCVGNSAYDSVIWNSTDGTPAVCPEDHQWNTKNGENASTTSNKYGIYDMNGGAWEFVMSTVVGAGGTPIFNSLTSFISDQLPDEKYYDIYSYNDDALYFIRGHLGDVTREFMNKINNVGNNWNGDEANFGGTDAPWVLMRGGAYTWEKGSGIFALNRRVGPDAAASFRVVLTAQDGED